MPTALVVGSGVAGPVAALALQRAGWDVKVAEARTDDASTDGLFLTMAVNGLDALAAVDAADPVRAVGFTTPWIRLRSGSGKVLGRVSTGAPRADGATGLTLRRTDLHRVLREEVGRRGIPVRHGCRLAGAEPVDGRVRVRFADGSAQTVDVLVGADGVRSTVRRVIDPAAPGPRYVPLLNTGGYAPPQRTDAEPGQYEMVFGRRGFFGYAVAPDGGVWWFANPPEPTEPTHEQLTAPGPDAWRRRLLEMVAEDHGPAADIIASTPGHLRAWTTHDLPTVRHWQRDGMVLVGDAAHAMSPSAGQGASTAVEDAVELARHLRDLPVAQALAGYERLRRPRVEKIVAQAARSTSTKAAGPVGRVVRDALLPAVLRATASSAAWPHAHHVDWSARVG